MVQKGRFDRMSILGVKKKKKTTEKNRVCSSESIVPCVVLRDAGQEGVGNGHFRKFESLMAW